MLFCNYSLPINDRAADAVSRLTNEEKISALGTATGELKSIGVNPYNWFVLLDAGYEHRALNPFVGKLGGVRPRMVSAMSTTTLRPPMPPMWLCPLQPLVPSIAPFGGIPELKSAVRLVLS